VTTTKPYSSQYQQLKLCEVEQSEVGWLYVHIRYIEHALGLEQRSKIRDPRCYLPSATDPVLENDIYFLCSVLVYDFTEHL
jgi:hypothetical protein